MHFFSNDSILKQTGLGKKYANVGSSYVERGQGKKLVLEAEQTMNKYGVVCWFAKFDTAVIG